MLFTKSTSWILKELSSLNSKPPRLCYVQDIADLKRGQLVVTDGAHFVQSTFINNAYFRMLDSYNKESLVLKGGILLLEAYKFIYSKSRIELRVENCIYMGEGSLACEPKDINNTNKMNYNTNKMNYNINRTNYNTNRTNYNTNKANCNINSLILKSFQRDYAYDLINKNAGYGPDWFFGNATSKLDFKSADLSPQILLSSLTSTELNFRSSDTVEFNKENLPEDPLGNPSKNPSKCADRRHLSDLPLITRKANTVKRLLRRNLHSKRKLARTPSRNVQLVNKRKEKPVNRKYVIWSQELSDCSDNKSLYHDGGKSLHHNDNDNHSHYDNTRNGNHSHHSDDHSYYEKISCEFKIQIKLHNQKLKNGTIFKKPVIKVGSYLPAGTKRHNTQDKVVASLEDFEHSGFLSIFESSWGSNSGATSSMNFSNFPSFDMKDIERDGNGPDKNVVFFMDFLDSEILEMSETDVRYIDFNVMAG